MLNVLVLFFNLFDKKEIPTIKAERHYIVKMTFKDILFNL